MSTKKILESEILRRVGTISRIVAATSDVRFKKFQLQKGQYIFVVRVCEHPGIYLVELTQLLNVDKSTTTKAIQKLEKAGYVRKSHPQDNRKNLALFPTEKAMIVYQELIQEENRGIEACLQGFSEEERADVMKYLERMSENIAEFY